MSRALVLKITCPANEDMNSHIHRFRNLGERLFLRFRDDRLAQVLLEDVDSSTDQLAIAKISSRELRRVKHLVMQIAKDDFPEAEILVSE